MDNTRRNSASSLSVIDGGKIGVDRSLLLQTEIRRPFQIYVAGPMSKHQFWNFPAFANATWHIRGRYQITVIDPSEIDMAKGFNPFTVAEDECSLEQWQDALRRDFRLILDCDGIALLPGWEKSKGANAELFVARTIGLQVFLYDPEEGLIWWPDESSDG